MAYHTVTKDTFVLMWKQQIPKMLMLQYAALIIATSLTAVSCQSVTIASNVSEGDIVCPGETVIFTCVTRGTFVLSWASEEYIGDVDVEIASERPNERVQALGNRNTFATVANVSMEGSTPVLVSQLQIVVSSVPLTPSVTCNNDFIGTSNTSTFRVQAEPSGVPQVTTAEYVMGTCGLNISLTAPANFSTGDTIRVYIDGNIQTVTSSDTVTSITVSYAVSSCSFLNVSARIVDRCGRQGLSSSTVTVNPDGVCNPSACTNDDTPGPPGPSDSALSTGVVVAIVVVVTAIVIAVVVFLAVVIGFCCYFNSTKNTPKRVSDMNLESKNDEEDTKFRKA